jgi:hypothetical protein
MLKETKFENYCVIWYLSANIHAFSFELFVLLVYGSFVCIVGLNSSFMHPYIYLPLKFIRFLFQELWLFVNVLRTCAGRNASIYLWPWHITSRSLIPSHLSLDSCFLTFFSSYLLDVSLLGKCINIIEQNERNRNNICWNYVMLLLIYFVLFSPTICISTSRFHEREGLNFM